MVWLSGGVCLLCGARVAVAGVERQVGVSLAGRACTRRVIARGQTGGFGDGVER